MSQKRKISSPNRDYSDSALTDRNRYPFVGDFQRLAVKFEVLKKNYTDNSSPISPAMLRKETGLDSMDRTFSKYNSEIKDYVPEPGEVDVNASRSNSIIRMNQVDSYNISATSNIEMIPEYESNQAPTPKVFKRRMTFRRGQTIFNDPENQKWARRFCAILEKASKENEQFKGLNRFFARKRLLEALQSKKNPLDQNQQMMLGDQANPANIFYKNQAGESSTHALRRKNMVKEYKKTGTANNLNSNNSYLARAKMLSMLKLAKKGKLNQNRFLQWFHIFKLWLTLVCGKFLQPLHPEGKIKIMWDLLSLLLILWEMVVTPLGISFPQSQTEFITNFQYFIDAYFIADIFINFQTGYYSKGVLNFNRRSIARKYLKRWFWVDLPASFPYDWVIPDQDNTGTVFSSTRLFRVLRLLRLLKILRLLRVLKLTRIFTRIESYLDLSLVLNSILSLLKLSGLLLIIAHWLACIWYLLGVLQTEYAETWLTQANLQDETWDVQYIASIYWAVTTMITVGYGDITPVTPNERILATCVMIVASGVFAFTMNSISRLLQQMNQGKADYQDVMISLNSYMKNKHISKELKGKVKNFLTYTLKYYNSIRNKEQVIMNLLSDQLKNEMMIEVNGRVLKAAKPFVEIFSKKMVMCLTLIMTQVIYSPDEIIFREDTEDDCSIYFLDNGSVHIHNYFSNTFFGTLSRLGETFGEIAFFTAQKRTASARSADFSGLFAIKRDDFLLLTEEHPRDRERFCMIKDQIQLQSNYAALNIECFSCKSTKHTVMKCPDLHYGVQKQKILEKYERELRMFGKKFERRKRGKGNFTFQKMQKRTQIFQRNYQDILAEDMRENAKNTNDSFHEPEKEKHMPYLRSNSIIGRGQYLEDFAEQFSIKNKRAKSLAPQEFTQHFQEQARMNQMNNFDNNSKDLRASEDNPTFDKIKNFEIYFPHNNFSKILKLDVKIRAELNARRQSLFQRREKTPTREPKNSSDRKKTFLGRLRDRISSYMHISEPKSPELKPGGSFIKSPALSVEKVVNEPTDNNADLTTVGLIKTDIDQKGPKNKTLRFDVQLEKSESKSNPRNELTPKFDLNSPQFKQNDPSFGDDLPQNDGVEDRRKTEKLRPSQQGWKEDRLGKKLVPVPNWTFARLSAGSQKNEFPDNLNSSRSLEEMKENEAMDPENAVGFLITRFGAERIAQAIRSQTQLQEIIECIKD